MLQQRALGSQGMQVSALGLGCMGTSELHDTNDDAESVFVAVSADFADSLAMGEAECLIEQMEQALNAISPRLLSIYIRPERRENAVTP